MNIFERRGIDLVGASNHVTLRGPLFKSHDTVRSPGVGPGIPPFSNSMVQHAHTQFGPLLPQQRWRIATRLDHI